MKDQRKTKEKTIENLVDYDATDIETYQESKKNYIMSNQTQRRTNIFHHTQNWVCIYGTKKYILIFGSLGIYSWKLWVLSL